jgi:lysozyme
MRQRLSAIGVFMLVAMVVLGGVTGCQKSADSREPEATEAADSQSTPASTAGAETPDTAQPTVVSAVTSTPGEATVPEATAPGTEADVQPTQVPIAGQTPTVQPTAGADAGLATPAATAAPPPASSGGNVVWHTVQPGETLSSIARRYGTTWQTVAQANSLSNPNQIYVGQKLKIPASSPGGSSGGSTGCRIRHTVKSGDWVWQIARDYGVSPYDILAANGLTIQSANTIYPGTVLCIP